VRKTNQAAGTDGVASRRSLKRDKIKNVKSTKPSSRFVFFSLSPSALEFSGVAAPNKFLRLIFVFEVLSRLN
jgi:hypothetical protein